MASFAILTSHVFSSKESPGAGRMGFQKPPAVSNSQRGNVRFRMLFKVRTMPQAFACAEGISEPPHMKSTNSLYEVLEISPAATAEDVKRAYRKLAKVFHPDHSASTEEKKQNTRMFLRIHNAYVTLSDPHDRAQYDRRLSAQVWGFAGQLCSKVSADGCKYWCGQVWPSWETDQCW